MIVLDRKTALDAPTLTRRQELDCARAWRDRRCESARISLIASHARIAWAMARRYARGDVEAEDDLAQHGLLGLMRALDKFDPDYGIRFSTYSRFWVKAQIADAAAACLVGVKMGARRFIAIRSGRIDFSDDPASAAAFGEISLSTPVGDGGAELGDLFVCAGERPDAAVETRSSRAFIAGALEAAMNALDPRERDIVRLRRLREIPVTLEELGQLYGVSRERIRQIEAAAIGKLRKAMAGFPKDLVD